MRFALEAAVFDGNPATIDDLDRLLLRVMDAVHTLYLTDGDLVEKSDWFLGQRPHRQELVRSQIHASTYPSPARVIRVGTELTLEAAVRLAFCPLRLVVENKTNDGLLVEVAILAYGSTELIYRWRSRPKSGVAIEVVHGGGTGDLKKQVCSIISEADGLPVRAIVMTDSDSRWPGDISKKAAEIDKTCQAAGVPCVVLSCRAAENYIPDGALVRWTDDPRATAARPQVEALLRLSPTQRDHFRMREGLRELEKRDVTSEHLALFAGVDAEDRLQLGRGFGDGCIKRLVEYLERPAPDEMDERDRRGDLRRLVSLIESEV